MDKLFILKSSLWMNYTITIFNYHRDRIIANEIRKSQYLDTPIISRSTIYIVQKTKDVLTINIQQNTLTGGLSKYREVYGNGVFIVSASWSNIRRYTTKVTFSEREEKQFKNYFPELNLKDLSGLRKENRHKNIYKKIWDIKNLSIAYNCVSRKKRANTPFIDQETLDGTSMEILSKISNELKDHSYKFKPIKRLYIPKADGSKRLLGIPNVQDKIVQKSVSMVLEEIFEPIFSDKSFGFRPQRSTHNALKNISTWRNVNWYIQGDFTKYFDNINHKILKKILEIYIDDKEFFDLYWKLVKAEYINPKTTKTEYSELGIPQGGTTSPIFSNIYLLEFDKIMGKLSLIFDDSNLVINPEYYALHTRITNLRNYYLSTYGWEKTEKISEGERLKEIKLLEKQRNKLKSKIFDKESFKIHYVRYADDFLIGIKGTKGKAYWLKKKLTLFLDSELSIELNERKTLITSALKFKVYFLRAYIRTSTSRTDNNKALRLQSKLTNRIFKRCTYSYKTLLLVPIDKIIHKLKEQGICKIINYNKRDIIPTKKKVWIFLSKEKIIRKYNYLWLGILNYYSFAWNRSQLNLIQYLLQHSCACTLMNKLKLSSRAKIFKKFGTNLKVSNNCYFRLRKSLKKISKFNFGVIPPYHLSNYNIRTKFLLLDQVCSICSSNLNVEMHHRRDLKSKWTDNTIKGIKINLSRKQIPLCRNCHNKVHQGKYDGLGLY